ncbi:PAS domain S-box protein [Candidatus Dojkabacteria bacterium]|nr:PAS domain S-box protein [Candidatus Dojkabacteria bacterium]
MSSVKKKQNKDTSKKTNLLLCSKVIFDRLPVGILIYSTKTREVIYLNKLLEKLLSIELPDVKRNITNVFSSISNKKKRNEVIDKLKKSCKVKNQGDLESLNFEYEIISNSSKRKIRQMCFNSKEEGLIYMTFWDITEEKEIEDQVQKSEKKYLGFLSNLPDSCFVIDENLRLDFINNAACKLLQIDPEEFIGKKLTKIIPDRKPIAIYKAFKRALQTGETTRVESLLILPDEKERAFDILISKVEGGIIVLARNITDEHKTKLALEESKQKFFELFENMSSGVAIYDPVDGGEDFIFTDFNKAGEWIEGLSRDDLIGTRVSKVFPGIKEFGLLDVLRDVYKTGEPKHHPVKFYKDGRIQGWRRNYVFKISSGQIIAIYDDITELKRAEEEKNQLISQQNILLENISEGVFLKDTKGKFVAVNQAYIDLMPYINKDPAGKGLFEVFPKNIAKKYNKLEKRVLKEGNKIIAEGVLEHKDGRQIDIISSLVPVTNSKGENTGIVGTLFDMTKQKEAEKIIKESEQRFRVLYENAPIAYQSLDDKGRILEVNKAWLTMLGYQKKDEVIGKSFTEFLTKKYRSKFKGKFNDFKKIKEIHNVEFEIKKKSGEKIIASFEGKASYDENGKFVRSFCTAYDITKRKRAERDLKASRKRYKAIIEDQSELICRFKPDGEITFANEAFLKFFAKDGQIIIGSDIKATVFKEDRQKVRGRFSLLNKNKQLNKGLNRNVDKNGKMRWISWTNRAIFDETGKLAEIQSTGRDITEEREMNLALRESENKYRSLVENLKQGILLYSQEGVIFLNSALAEIVGIPESEKIEPQFSLEEIWEYIHPDDREQIRDNALNRFKGKKVTPNYEMRIIRTDGEIRWVEGYSTVIEYSGKPAIQTALWDITNQKKAREELEKAKQLAESSSKAKEEFLANMSHEIRTPLNTVTGMSEVLLQTELSNEQKDFVEAIKLSSDNLLMIINDILDISKIEAGQMVFSDNVFNIRKLLDNTLKTQMYKAQEKNLKVGIIVDSKIPKKLLGDEVRLNQILLNLLNNAIKFTYKGKVTLQVDLIRSKETEVELLFKVKDTGVGIPQSKQRYIFDSFTQVKNQKDKKTEGTGLGLAIVKRLVEMQGGDVEVKSKVGKGSTFSFNMKFRKISKKEQRKKDTNKVEKKDSLKKKKILVVEDNVMNQVIVGRLLEQWGAEVEKAGDGKEALDYMKKRKFDLVLMDLNMPGMGGYEATERIRDSKDENTAQVPIIAMTAHAFLQVKEKVLSSGMDDYITKPFKSSELYSKIINLIET